MKYSKLVSKILPVTLLIAVLVGCEDNYSSNQPSSPPIVLSPPVIHYEYTNPETGQTIYGNEPIPPSEKPTRTNSLSGSYLGRIGPYVEIITFSGSRATIQGPIQVDICEYKITNGSRTIIFTNIYSQEVIKRTFAYDKESNTIAMDTVVYVPYNPE